MAELTIARAAAIDAAGTRDRDDAVWVQRQGNEFEITVTITDVASAITPGSKADMLARAAGSTIYRGEGNSRPMLPRDLEQRLTLGARRDAPVLAVRTTLRPDLNVSSQIVAGVLSATTIVEYPQVDAILSEGAQDGGADPELRLMLTDAARLANILFNRRRQRGALAVYDVVTGIASNEEGELLHLDPHQQHIGHLIVQELMIMANEAVATWAAENRLPIIYRNHHASAVAPPRERLLSDLTAAAQHPESFDLDTLERRRQLVLESAFYAPYVSGHYGLNLPCYTHATSPLRRYADLRTQQIVLARLRGEALPEVEETAAITEDLTARAKIRSQERGEWFKEQARQESLRISAAAQLNSLSADEFHEALKNRLRVGQMTGALADEALRRFSADLAQARDALLVLFTAGAPDELRAATADWLQAHPEHAISVVGMLSQSEGIEAAQFEEESIGPIHHRKFKTRATMERGEQNYSGAWRNAPAKRLARAQAALSLLCALAAIEDKSADITAGDETPESEQESTLPSLAGHPVASLLEWAQAWGHPRPDFAYTSTGMPHQPSFDCQVTIALPDGEFAATGSGSTKAAAREQASAALIAIIRAR